MERGGRGASGATPAASSSRERRLARRVERDGGISVEYDSDAAGFDDVESTFRLGQRVRHAKFGEGEVRGFTGTGTDLKLTVYFPSGGAQDDRRALRGARVRARA